MKTSSQPHSCLKILTVILLGIFVFSGCASSSGRSAFRPQRGPTRTELVLLNVPEGSGWVAFKKDEGSQQIEDYRIVVIRQSTDELIYDSVIPLAASMETHGFELAKDDPRLQDLAMTVDRSIIEPLESVMPQLAAVENDRTAPVAEESAGEMAQPSAMRPMSTPRPPAAVEPQDDPTQLEPPQLVESDQDYPLIRRNGDQVIIQMPAENSLSEGDRLFIREADRTITLPGEDQQKLISKGSLTGLVQVRSVKGRIANTLLLSGYMPKNPVFEPNE